LTPDTLESRSLNHSGPQFPVRKCFPIRTPFEFQMFLHTCQCFQVGESFTLE
jgi:hypothetical protein